MVLFSKTMKLLPALYCQHIFVLETSSHVVQTLYIETYNHLHMITLMRMFLWFAHNHFHSLIRTLKCTQATKAICKSASMNNQNATYPITNDCLDYLHKPSSSQQNNLPNLKHLLAANINHQISFRINDSWYGQEYSLLSAKPIQRKHDNLNKVL